MAETPQGSAASKTLGFLQSITYPVVLLASSAVVLYSRLQLQFARGNSFDPYAFLAQGLTMAGKSTYFEVGRPPVLPFILSLFFRAGITSETIIFYIDAAFLLLGVLGFYYLLRLRFGRTLSLLGALLFISFPDLILYATFGFTDIMAVALSVWTLYFAILAVEKNSRWYWLLFPLFVITFLTRFTAGLMLIPIAFYILARGRVMATMKHIALGIALAAIPIVIDIAYYVRVAGPDASAQLTFPLSVAGQAPGELTKAIGTRAYYLTHLPTLVSRSTPALALLLPLAAVGFAALLFGLVRTRSKDSPLFLSLAVAGAGVALIAYLIYVRLNFLLIAALLLALFLVVAKMFSFSTKDVSIDLTMLLWLLVFLVFHSQLPVKTSRYFITMIPGIAFFTILGLDAIRRVIGRVVPVKPVRYGLGAVLAAVVAALIVLSTSASLAYAYSHKTWEVKGVKEAAIWLKGRLSEKDVVYSDYWVAYAWYLRQDIKAMPTFEGDPREFANELYKANADYYVAFGARALPGYTLVNKSGEMTVYKKTAPPPNKPRVFLIGRGIDHYLEDELDFQIYLIRAKSPFPDISSYLSVSRTFVDGYTLRDLRRYPVLLLYDFRWHDLEAAERLLESYAAAGGTIILDASGNTGTASYDLRNKTFLDTNILPSTLPKTGRVEIQKSSLSRGVDRSSFAAFVSETGDEWGGTTYEASVGGAPLTDLVSVAGRPLVSARPVGKGRLILVGYNFFFHAFRAKNEPEKQLIRNLFQAALKQDL